MNGSRLRRCAIIMLRLTYCGMSFHAVVGHDAISLGEFVRLHQNYFFFPPPPEGFSSVFELPAIQLAKSKFCNAFVAPFAPESGLLAEISSNSAFVSASTVVHHQSASLSCIVRL